MSSKRQFPRYAHEATLTLSYGDRMVKGTTSNVSRGGICAMVDAHVPVGTQAEAELALVFGEGSYSEPVQLVVRVVWCTAMEAGHQIGLSFATLSTSQQQVVDILLKFLDEGATQRRAAAGGGRRDPFE